MLLQLESFLIYLNSCSAMIPLLLAHAPGAGRFPFWYELIIKRKWLSQQMSCWLNTRDLAGLLNYQEITVSSTCWWSKDHFFSACACHLIVLRWEFCYAVIWLLVFPGPPSLISLLACSISNIKILFFNHVLYIKPKCCLTILSFPFDFRNVFHVVLHQPYWVIIFLVFSPRHISKAFLGF